jgi:hypothetical protein
MARLTMQGDAGGWRRTTVAALVLAPTAAFVLHDFVFQLPDNQHEASAGFFITLAGLLAVWAAAGYAGAGTGRGRALRGAAWAALSVAVLGLTFAVLNTLFVDRMSYEPDRIRAFRRSGEATMADYVKHQGAAPFPLLHAVAAAAGAGGAAFGRRRSPKPA